MTSVACRSAKYIEDNQALVVKNEIEGVPVELKEPIHSYISNEIRPNSRLNLLIYNLFNTKNGKYKTDGIRNVGEPPNILDSAMVDLSSSHIQGYLKNKGYFHAEIDSDIEITNKRAKVHYSIDLGNPFFIGDLDSQISDSSLASIYQNEVRPNSVLKEATQYDVNNLVRERELAYETFRNNGYYDYLRQYMRIGVDTTNRRYVADLSVEIENPADDSPHTVYHIDSVYVNVLHPDSGSRRMTMLDTNLHVVFNDQTGSFKLKPLARYMFLQRGDRYSLQQENLSYDRLYEMNGFRSIKINYERVDSAKLNVFYEMLPRPVMGNQVEGEYTFSSGMSGFNIGNTFSHRNVFGGAEQLDINLRYGVLFDPRLSGSLSQKIFNRDMQIGVNLVIPRLMIPFYIRNVSKYGLPKTTFSSNLQLFNQLKAYSNRYLINTLNYTWYQSVNKLHSYSPIVLEYRVGRLDVDFADQLVEDGYLLYVRSNNREYFGLGTQYSFTLNAPKLRTRETFNYFKGSLDASGNVLSLFSNMLNLSKNSDGERLLFNVPYLQYAKGEVDYRWYKHLGGNRQLVFRFNSGIAVPYGNNSSLLIFEKSFFGGGMNGIRAWQARTLGPGSYNREVLPENLRLNMRNLDQLGELKIEGNIEYRFRLLNSFLGAKLNGATFLDLGNVWRIRENELNPGGEFKMNSFLDQVAIGTGFGLRVDMDYFVIRLDAGLKVKDPQFRGSEQWVIQHVFDSKEFKQKYLNTHRPDRYGFMQFNFGVGLPF